MGVVNENAGARKGALILMRDGKPILDAILDESSGVAKTLLGQSLEDQDYVPISFIKYIARTKRSAIGNLRDDLQKFSQEDYFKSIKPESILGLPILNQRRLVGVLYLENELTKNVFTPQRVELLSVLSSQIAVSLDNAMLYQNLEHKVAERTKELAQEKRKSDELLANVLPKEVARELKEKGLFITKFKLEELENELNFQGDLGWGLASSFATDLDNNGKKEVVLIFKRAIEG